MVREWSDAILFAVVAATIIRTFVIEAYKIPTTSLEGSLLEGDFICKQIKLWRSNTNNANCYSFSIIQFQKTKTMLTPK